MMRYRNTSAESAHAGQFTIGTSGGTHAWTSAAVATMLAAASGSAGALGSNTNRGAISSTVIVSTTRCAG